MDRKAIKSEIRKYLAGQKEVIFVYLFGSFVQEERFRDIDIAIYTNSIPDLMRVGGMQANLSSVVKKQVDLVLLNNLPAKKPALAYNIVAEGEVLLNTDREKHTNFKRKTFLRYFDTARLREDINRAFEERLETDKFGQRNYE